jgi:hypothetical protein
VLGREDKLEFVLTAPLVQHLAQLVRKGDEAFLVTLARDPQEQVVHVYVDSPEGETLFRAELAVQQRADDGAQALAVPLAGVERDYPPN